MICQKTRLCLLAVFFGWAISPAANVSVEAHETGGHPSATQLLRLKKGKLTDAEAAVVHEHFAVCLDCAGFFANCGTCKKCATLSCKTASATKAAATTPAHPSDAHLALLKEGHLAEADAAAVHKHFAHCDRCTQAFTAMMEASAEAEPVAAVNPVTAAPAPQPATPAPSGHPSDALLALLKEGHLAEADAALVHEHFALCDQCTQAFTAMMEASAEAEPVAAINPAAAAAAAPASQPASPAHPSDAQLALLKEGHLAEADAALVHEHFALCDQCTQAFTAMMEASAEAEPVAINPTAAAAAAPASQPASPAHPSDAQLALLKEGHLAEADAAAVHEHFANCDQCTQAFVVMMAASAETEPVASDPATVAVPPAAAPENSAHPSDAQLALLKEGHLAEADAAAVHEHFANCDQCTQAFVAMLEASAQAEPAAEAIAHTHGHPAEKHTHAASPSAPPEASAAAGSAGGTIGCKEIGTRISQLEDRVTRLIEIARHGRPADAHPHGEDCQCCVQHRRQLEGLEKKLSELEGSLR